MKTRTKIDLILLTAACGLAVIAIPKAQTIGDWWHSRHYKPSAEIVRLALDAGMSPEGKRLFYRFSPRIVSGPELEANCGSVRLGCVEGQSMYLLEGTRSQYNTLVVTAAHEMLHIVYHRMSQDEKNQLHLLIEEQISVITNLESKLETYPVDAYLTEAHSIIGSEASPLIPQLEVHYGKYFHDRQLSVNAYRASPEVD